MASRIRSITRSSSTNHLVVETFDGEKFELEGIASFEVQMSSLRWEGDDGNCICIVPVKGYEALAVMSARKLADLVGGEVVMEPIKVEFS